MSKQDLLSNDTSINKCRAKVELSAGLLAKLITSGIVCANECICLDDNAKKVVWQSLLSSSAMSEHSLC